MLDAVIVGGGIAGLAAGWRLRNWDIKVLEAEKRIGGRVRSERRGRYWLNWGGHVYAGAGSATEQLFNEVGITAVEIPGALTAMSMNGKLLKSGHLATYPFRLPMSLKDRYYTLKVGSKILWKLVSGYLGVVRTKSGESAASRQQRIYDFENERTFLDFTGYMPEDAASIFATTVTRSSGNMDQISAGAGIGYFSLVLGIGQGLNLGIVGGPSTMTESIETALGDKVELGARVTEVVNKPNSVIVRYTQDGKDHEVEARAVVMATTANMTHEVAVDLPWDLKDALSKVNYGPHVSTAFLTNETTPKPWDGIYAISCPKRSFAIALNQASIVRSTEKERQPGGSFMTFSPAGLGRKLLEIPKEEVVATHLKDLDQVLGHGFADSVVEAECDRWEYASPYCAPGRARIQPTLMRGTERIKLAGDYLGTLYTESSIASGFAAAQEISSLLGTERVHIQTGK